MKLGFPNLGNGNNISLTPCKTKAPPKPTTALVILPAAAKDPGPTRNLSRNYSTASHAMGCTGC